MQQFILPVSQICDQITCVAKSRKTSVSGEDGPTWKIHLEIKSQGQGYSSVAWV